MTFDEQWRRAAVSLVNQTGTRAPRNADGTFAKAERVGPTGLPYAPEPAAVERTDKEQALEDQYQDTFNERNKSRIARNEGKKHSPEELDRVMRSWGNN